MADYTSTHRNDRLFERVGRAALPYVTVILDRLGVTYRQAGVEVQMLNPLRDDRKFGSFSINTRTGLWSEFATAKSGRDVISLVAYLRGTRQIEAAKELATMLGVQFRE